MVIPQLLTPLFSPASSTVIITGLTYAIISLSGIMTCHMILNMRSYASVSDLTLYSMANNTYAMTMNESTADEHEGDLELQFFCPCSSSVGCEEEGEGEVLDGNAIDTECEDG